MKRILIKIAYNGSMFSGWDKNSSKNSVEKLLNETISNLTGETISIIGTSRTDSGVHANCNIAVFDTNSSINPDKFYFAINNLLPNYISITESYEVNAEFNPRKAKCKKTYIYRIHNSKVRNPIKEFNAYFVYYNISIDKMIEASKFLIGEHNFISFINPESQQILNAKKKEAFVNENLTTRTIYEINIKKEDEIISIEITGNGFLYNMVRIIAGTLLKIGMNMWEPSYIKDILMLKNRKYAGFTLPANGLTLESITFV